MQKANTAKSRKAKGTRLEMKVASEMRRSGLDPYARRQPMSGAIEWLKNDISNSIGLNIECKNQEKVKLWEWWQLVRDQQNGRLIISGNHRPVIVVLSLEDWLSLEKYKKDFENQNKPPN